MTGFACDVFYFVLGKRFIGYNNFLVAFLTGYFCMLAVEFKGGYVVVKFLNRPLFHSMTALAITFSINRKLSVMVIKMAMAAIC